MLKVGGRKDDRRFPGQQARQLHAAKHRHVDIQKKKVNFIVF